MRKARVLMVVEDDADIRMLIRFHFQTEEFFAIEGQAETAEEAIPLAANSHPDLIILDHKLNGPMTGLQAAEPLKQAVPDAKIILFSASEELREPAMDSAFVDAFLLKTDIFDLVGVAKRVLAIG